MHGCDTSMKGVKAYLSTELLETKTDVCKSQVA